MVVARDGALKLRDGVLGGLVDLEHELTEARVHEAALLRRQLVTALLNQGMRQPDQRLRAAIGATHRVAVLDQQERDEAVDIAHALVRGARHVKERDGPPHCSRQVAVEGLVDRVRHDLVEAQELSELDRPVRHGLEVLEREEAVVQQLEQLDEAHRALVISARQPAVEQVAEPLARVVDDPEHHAMDAQTR